MPAQMDSAAAPLSAEQISLNFADVEPPLSPDQALVESSRCYFCYDAPCMEACPTGIDIPSFIRKISTGNLKGSAITILEENIFGGACARVCPTEILCEQACVREAQESKPVRIGALQRRSTDWLMEQGIQPFTRAPASGFRVAVLGAGPAGLACAHRLAMHGHAVTVFEARAKSGGLNEYGIAAYKMTDDFAQREVDFILSIGGITVEHDRALGRDLDLATLRTTYDAVFLAIGQAGVNALGLADEAVGGVQDAVAFIETLRQSPDIAKSTIGRQVVVVGGGNTAIDAATQARLLGAEDVTIIYRRGPEHMSATTAEQEWTQVNGVRIRHWLAPVALESRDGHVTAIVCAPTRVVNSQLVLDDERVTFPADRVLKAVGQRFLPEPLGSAEMPVVANGRIVVDADRRTSLANVFAGGDCVAGQDLTVSAVQDGKVAAEALHCMLTEAKG